jgi:hypothetical protein
MNEGRGVVWRKKTILNAACSFAALFLLTTTASAQCAQSPKVLRAPQGQRAKLTTACANANGKMHGICDKVPTCTQADTKDVLKRKITNAQKCIDARRAITRDWFDGNSDAGHDAAVEGKVNQANNCIVLYSKK